MSCFIHEVLAPNGETSRLFDDILSTVGDPTRALSLYLDSKLQGPGEARTDNNGEPLLSAIYQFVGLTDAERDVFLSQRPDMHAPRAGTKSNKRRNELPEEIQGVEAMINITIRRIQDARDSVKETDARQWYDEQIARLQDQRNRIFWQDTAADIQKVAEEQLKWAKKIAMSRNPSKRSLRLAMDLVNSWSWDSLSTFLSVENSAEDTFWSEMFSNISSEANRITLFVDNAIIKNVQRTMSREGVEADESDLRQMNAIGATRRLLFDLSTVDNKLAQFIDATLKRGSRNQAEHLRQISARLAEFSNGVNQQNLLQKDDKGQLTGNLIAPFSIEYMENIRKAQAYLQIQIDKAQGASSKEAQSRILRLAHQKYYRRRRAAEHAVDVSRLNDPKYIRELKDDLGEDGYNQAVDDAKAALVQFEAEQNAAEERFRAEFIGQEAELKKIDGKDETLNQYMERRMQEWLLANSPEQFHKEFSSNQSVYHSANGHRFVVLIPKKKEPNGTPSKNYDSAYDALSNKEREFLDYVLQLSSDLRSFLPESKTRDLGAGFLPVVHKDLTERLLDHDFSGARDQASKKLFSSFTDDTILRLTEQQERSREVTHPVTGDEIRGIPIRFLEGAILKKFNEESDEEFEKRRKDAISGRSFDIVKVMEMFAGMAINYHHMSNIEDKVLLAQRIVNEAEEIRTKGDKGVFNKFGKLVTMKDGKTHLKEMVQYSIDAMMYGAARLDDEGVTNTVLYSTNIRENRKSANKARELRQKHANLEEAHDNDKIDDKEYETTLEALNQEYEALGGRRLSAGKSLENLLKFTQMKGMGWNLTAGIANLGFGFMSNVVHSGAGVDFNGKELLQAFQIMLKSRTNPNTKVSAMIKKLDVLFEVTEIGYGKNAERRRFKKLDFVVNPYEIQRRTEYFLQGQSVVAQLLHEKIEDAEGKERSLWDAFNKDGTWNEEEFGPEPNEWKSLLDGAEQNKLTQFRDRAIAVNKKLHGNYDPNSVVEAKKWVMGRALLMFRSWMAEGFEWRFAHEHYDRQLGRTIKGRWITYRDVARDHGVSNMTSRIMKGFFNKAGLGEDLTEIDLQNMKSNVTELRLYLGLMAVGVLMKMALEDDDDDEGNLAIISGRILLAQLYRVEKDMVFYMSPSTMIEITKNPIPAMKTFSDFSKAGAGTMAYLQKGEEYQGLEPWYKWMKAFPLGTQAYKTWYMGSHEVNWDDM